MYKTEKKNLSKKDVFCEKKKIFCDKKSNTSTEIMLNQLQAPDIVNRQQAKNPHMSWQNQAGIQRPMVRKLRAEMSTGTAAKLPRHTGDALRATGSLYLPRFINGQTEATNENRRIDPDYDGQRNCMETQKWKKKLTTNKGWLFCRAALRTPSLNSLGGASCGVTRPPSDKPLLAKCIFTTSSCCISWKGLDDHHDLSKLWWSLWIATTLPDPFQKLPDSSPFQLALLSSCNVLHQLSKLHRPDGPALGLPPKWLLCHGVIAVPSLSLLVHHLHQLHPEIT